MTDEVRQCTRCFLTGSVIHFEKNKKGDWFKQCNNCRIGCREREKAYRQVHKDRIKHKQLENKRKKDMKKTLEEEMEAMEL